MIKIQRAVSDVHTHDAQGFLLLHRLLIQHTDVDDHLRRFGHWFRLESDPKPAVIFVVAAFVSARLDGVGENEKAGARSSLLLEALLHELILVIEHVLQSLPGDVAFRVAVNGVTHGHVVSGNRLGDRPCSAAYAEKPARNLLPGAYLRKGPVLRRIQIYIEGLLMRSLQFTCHDHLK